MKSTTRAESMEVVSEIEELGIKWPAMSYFFAKISLHQLLLHHHHRIITIKPTTRLSIHLSNLPEPVRLTRPSQWEPQLAKLGLKANRRAEHLFISTNSSSSISPSAPSSLSLCRLRRSPLHLPGKGLIVIQQTEFANGYSHLVSRLLSAIPLSRRRQALYHPTHPLASMK